MKALRSTRSITVKSLLLSLSLTLILSPLLPANTAHALTAQKTSSGTHRPGETAPIEIRLAAPTSTPPNIEVSFALDASGSMAGDMNNLKSQIKTFAAWVYNNGFANRTTISVTSFSRLPCSPNSANLDYDNPLIEIAVNRTKLTSATSINAAIDSMQPSLICPGESIYYGFSDVTAGIAAAGDRFTTAVGAPNSRKILVLLSDGFQNMPASGSGSPNAYSTTWTGTCALARSGSADVMNITRKHDDFFAITAGGQSGSALPVNQSSFAGITPFYASCNSYISALGTSVTGASYMSRMVNAFPGGSSKTITSAITAIQNTLVNTIQINDYLNPDVFTTAAGTIVGPIVVENCSTSTRSVITSGVNINSSGNRIYGTIAYTPGITYYCIKFNATVKPNPVFGTPPINSSANQPANCATVAESATDVNIIRYRNAANSVISCDTISLGSVVIENHPNLVVQDFYLANSSGTKGSVFNVGQNIYTYTRLANTGTSTVDAGTKTAFYKNRPSNVAANTASDIPFYIINHGSFGAGLVRSYSSWSGTNWANNANTTSPSSVVGAPSFWTEGVANNYTARVFANFQNSADENSYPADNQFGYNYSVIVQPKNLAQTTPTCTTANLTWTAGSSNVIAYRLVLSSGGSVVRTVNLPGNVSNTNLTGLVGNTSYSWTLQANTANGFSPDIIGPVNFSTPTCQSFDTDLFDGTIITPGGDTATQSVSLTFNPSSSTWGSDTVNIKVVAILSGTSTCGGYGPGNAAVTAGSGAASGITANMPPYPSGRTGTATRRGIDSNPFAIRLAASDTTAPGTYTICIASSSSYGSANDPIVPQTFEVRNLKWLQIDANAISRNAGDVHSNGSLGFNVPYGKYFFKSVAGLVSANSANAQGLDIDSSRLASVAQWRVPTYQPFIPTPGYQNLYTIVTDNMEAEPELRAATSSGSGSSHISSQCSQNATKAFRIEGNLTRNSSLTLTNTNCPNANLIYFVSGDLTVTQNIADDTSRSSITHIVNGDIIIGPNVQRLDGTYIFGGKFNTQAGTNPLTIKGSLIGLAGSSPSNSSGTFQNGAQSGLLRDLGAGNTNPAETIIYQPKYLEVLKPLLGVSTFSWVE